MLTFICLFKPTLDMLDDNKMANKKCPLQWGSQS